MAHLQTRSSQTFTPPVAAARPLVLVVDPDESSRSVLDVALGREGFEVWSAGTASEANLLLTGRAPDLIVLESALGGDDGYTFVATLRGDERLAEVPVLLLAAPGEENEAALAEVVGVDEIIRKPAFARDVTALARLELLRRAGGPLTFDAEVLPPERMLRALLSTPRSGHLTLAGGRAVLQFRAGKVITARFGALAPSVELVVRALALTRGAYTVALEPVTAELELNCRLQEVVNVVVPRLARWQRALLKSLPLETRLAIDFARLKGQPQLPDEVSAVLRLFDGFRTVERVLIDSPLPEGVTLETATRLFLMGVLTHAQGGDEALFTLRPMPKLFEPPASEARELMEKLFAGEAEIRAADASDEEPGDWYAPVSARDELLGDAPGEWTSAPVPEALAVGLSPAVQQQLEAFATPMQVQERAVPALHIDAQQVEVSATPALRLDAREASAVPAIHVDAQKQLETSARSALDVDARQQLNAQQLQVSAMPVQARGDHADDDSSRVENSEALSATRATAEAALSDAAEEAFFGIEESPAPKSRRTPWPFVIGGVLLLAIAALFELRPADAPKPAPEIVVAPVAPQVEAAPVVAVEPEPVEAEPPPAIDVTENLALGSQLYEHGEYQKAITVLEQVVADAPESVNGWLQLGLARYDSGDAKGARDAADKVLALAPKNGRVQLLLATLYFDADDRDQGRAAIQKYLELEPNGAHVAEAKALLR